MTAKQANLTGGGRLARNVCWNIVGTGAPLLVAIIAIPMLIDGLGKARFGVLTLAWMVVGYFSLFDLGLGRALTKLVAEKLGNGRHEEIPSLIWTAIALMSVLGLLGAMIVAALSPWLVGKVLKIPPELQPETLAAFYLLAVSIPIVIGTTGLRGILEAHQRFDLVNAVRIPLGVLTFLGPIAVLPFSNSLVALVAVLVGIRLIAWFAYAALCLPVQTDLTQSVKLHWPLVWPLLDFGGWMTLTNVVGPLMVYLDRFLIGVMVSMTAVAYYATPYEVVTKLWIVPGALMGVMFPAFATSLAQDRLRTVQLFGRTVNYIFLSLFPVVLIVVTFAHEGLALWLGDDFAGNSSLVLKLFAIGVFVNSHAFVPFGLVQGAGRPDLTAKLHLIELPFYLVTLWWMLHMYGIAGAAIAWVLRVVIDAVLLFVMADRVLLTASTFTLRPMFAAGVALFLITLGSVISGVTIKTMFLLLVMLFFCPTVWFVMLAPDEKRMIRNHLKKIPIFGH